MEVDSAVVGGVGGTTLIGMCLMLWRAFSAANRATTTDAVSNDLSRHMYARIRELETREKALNDKLLSQSRLIGELTNQVTELTARDKLRDATEKALTRQVADLKGLLTKITTAYEKEKSDNATLLSRIEAAERRVSSGVLPTKSEARPWLPGDKK